MDVINTITTNRLWNKHSLKLAWGGALLLLALVLASIAWTTWNQVKIKQINYQPQTVAAINTSNKPSYRVNDIVAANLFGDPTPAPVVKVAPKTTLDLTLIGVLWSSDNTVGRAIIKPGRKAAGLYSVGENIKGAGASVQEIRDDEIILDRNGALESLPLQKKTDSGNRQIITFNNGQTANPNIDPVVNFEQHTNGQPNNTNVRTPTTPNNQSAPSRRVRRPSFSGLDRALEKMEELNDEL